MCVSAIVLIPVRRYADRLGLLARPGAHRTHASPTPLGGGIGIYAGVVLPLIAGAIYLTVTGGGDRLAAVAEGIAARGFEAVCLLVAATTLMLLGSGRRSLATAGDTAAGGAVPGRRGGRPGFEY